MGPGGAKSCFREGLRGRDGLARTLPFPKIKLRFTDARPHDSWGGVVLMRPAVPSRAPSKPMGDTHHLSLPVPWFFGMGFRGKFSWVIEKPHLLSTYCVPGIV